MSKTGIGGPFSYIMRDKACLLGALFEPRIGSPKSQGQTVIWPQRSPFKVGRAAGENALNIFEGQLDARSQSAGW